MYLCITDIIYDFDVYFIVVFTDDTLDVDAQAIRVNQEGHVDTEEFISIRLRRLAEVTSNQTGWFHIDI